MATENEKERMEHISFKSIKLILIDNFDKLSIIMDQNVYALRVNENHIKVTAGNVRLHFTPEDAKELLLDSGNYDYGNSVVIIEEDTIEIVPNWGSSWCNGLTAPFYRILFNKKQFQDEIRKALVLPESIKTDSNDLKIGDIILHSKVPHKILTKDAFVPGESSPKRWSGVVMNLTTGETVPYQFTQSYSATKLISFVYSVEEASGCEWAFGVNSNEYTSSVNYVWWNDNKFVVGTV